MYAQQGRYLRNQQALELKGMMKKLKQFPVEHFKVYHGVPVGRRSMPGFNSGLSSISSQPVLNRFSCLVSSAPTCGNTEQNKAVFPKMTAEVSAFGPKHAEHARRFYKSQGLLSQDFRQVSETILKVAKISPRPSKKQLTITKTLVVKIVNNRIEKGLGEKSVDFQAGEHEIDLPNTTLFKILDEISRYRVPYKKMIDNSA